MTTYQALTLGVPLIVLPAHANQHFYAEAVVRNQFGYLFHPSRLSVNKLVKATLKLLGDDTIKQSIHSFRRKLTTL